MMIIFTLIIALLIGYLTYRNTVYGVYTVLALLPAYLIRINIGVIPFTLLEVAIISVTIVWFTKLPHRDLYNRTQARKLFMHYGALTFWWYLIVFFIITTTIATIISPNHIAALGIWKAYFVEPIIFFAVCISTLKNSKEIRTAFDFIFIGISMAAIISIIQKFTGWWIPNLYWQVEATRRVTSIYGYPNAFPLIAAPLVPFIFFQWREHYKLVIRLLYILLGVAMILAILFAKSDGALAGLGVGLLIAGIWNKTTKFYTLLFTLFLALTIFFTPPLKEMFASHFLFQKISGQLRLSMWQETFEMLKINPLRGGGLANYQSAILPYHELQWAEIYLYPHNIFLNFWSETGLFGLISFCALTIFFFIRGAMLWFKNNSLIIKTTIISMIILLVHGLVDVPYFKNDLAVLFWLIMAILVVNEKYIFKRT